MKKWHGLKSFHPTRGVGGGGGGGGGGGWTPTTIPILSNLILTDSIIQFDCDQPCDGLWAVFSSDPGYTVTDDTGTLTADLGSADGYATFDIVEGDATYSFDFTGISDGSKWLAISGSNVIGDGNILVEAFTLAASDTTAPAFVIAEMPTPSSYSVASTVATFGFTALVVTLDELCDVAHNTSAGDWTVLSDGSPVTITSAALDASDKTKINIVLSASVASNNIVTVAYSGTTLRDDAGNLVATFSAKPVWKNVAVDAGFDDVSGTVWNATAGAAIGSSEVTFDGSGVGNLTGKIYIPVKTNQVHRISAFCTAEGSIGATTHKLTQYHYQYDSSKAQLSTGALPAYDIQIGWQPIDDTVMDQATVAYTKVRFVLALNTTGTLTEYKLWVA